jgi:heavy metal sensor kinase
MLIRNRSISFRLTIWFLSIFFMGLILFGAAMWLDLRHSLMTVRRQTLEHRVDRLGQLLRESQSASLTARQHKFHEFASATGDGLIEIFDRGGGRAYPSPSASAAAFPWPGVTSGERHFSKASFSGQPYLVLVRPIQVGQQTLFLCVAASLTNNRQLLQRFSLGLLATLPILLILSAASGYFISRKALGPVDRITASVQSMTFSNLSGRLPVTNSGDELQRLSETFNAMLVRLDSAVSRIKQFTGDASHELRGPLSYIRMVAELALRKSKADKESRKAFEEIVAESAKAAVLLEDMLTLARADSGDHNLIMESVDLAKLLNEVCDKIRPLADARRQTLVVQIDSKDSTEVMADDSSLSRLFWTLIDNAVKYTPLDGSIEVRLTSAPGQAIVTVKDNGVGIAEADLPFIFERFFRADPSRSQVDGTGLGLAIAKWVAELHHARLSASSEVGKGTSFEIVFPHTDNFYPNASVARAASV